MTQSGVAFSFILEIEKTKYNNEEFDPGSG